MGISATEKLLKKNFGIASFKEVIQKLENEGELTFKENLFIEKSLFIEKIQQIDASINDLSSAYSMALEMGRSGSVFESFARDGIGSLRMEYIKQRKLMVNYISFFYKLRI
jgi:hypothetical protein